MEWYTELNFRFNDDKIQAEVGALFKSMRENRRLTKELVKEGFVEIFPEHLSDIDAYFKDGTCWELFEAIETVNIQSKKLRVVSLCGSGVDRIVPNFMKFLVSIDGKPLASKASGDESTISFKYLKSGKIEISVKDDEEG